MSDAAGAERRVPALALGVPEAPSEMDRDARFDALFLGYYPRVVSIIGRVVGDRSRAEQLASDVFWKLHRKAPDGDGGSIGGWLYRSAVHVALDALRVGARQSRHEMAAAAERMRNERPRDPLDQLLADEQRAQVRAVLARMKPRHARLLLLRASGLSYEEIARAVGGNPGSVGTWLARAHRHFERHYRALHGKAD